MLDANAENKGTENVTNNDLLWSISNLFSEFLQRENQSYIKNIPDIWATI